ncbi:MAG: 2-succinyl-5-enolpyruvyl-6-hydroxy-3-cyclohexene-1-carboxylic-acid synthase [Anaerolineales bacterium]|nr:2-succinyl-5-enolpyruvyl-6-hydroxy-3-cyclohexene-1-carboxylic-acid synthase [Anaerolineales bacterium]
MNPSTVWATTFVRELAAAGLTAVSLAPGSRSTPLTLAFEAHPQIEVHLHLDERSAGFFALGMALTRNRPVALVCTSGTAVANFMPAVVEANMSQVPLLVLTADRPPELRHSGANQTIDQVKFFGDQVLWSVDVALPQETAPDVALRNLRTLAARAYALADGLRKGPVHLNFPFRKPLEPDFVGKYPVNKRPFTQVQRGQLTLTSDQISQLALLISTNPCGLIICGPRCPDGDFPTAVAALGCKTGYPIFADPISGLRFGSHVAETAVISGYETFLRHDPAWPSPQLILRFGAVPTSKWLNTYLERVQPEHRIHICENGVWADEDHRTTLFLQANATAVCKELGDRIEVSESDWWAATVVQTEKKHWQTLNAKLVTANFDGAYVADIVDLIPENTTLFMGNSLPIRHLDQFGQARAKKINVYANRGASGIDGNISTALGCHVGNGNGRLVAVVGDITFYHDLNGLLAIKQLKLKNLTIILLNNNGGGIFHRLPVAAHEPAFSRLFATPHDLNFAPVIQMYGLQHVRVSTRSDFQTALRSVLAAPQPTVIEVQTDRQTDITQLKALVVGA